MKQKIDENNRESRIARAIWKSAFWLGIIIIAMFVTLVVKSAEKDIRPIENVQQEDNRYKDNNLYLKLGDSNFSYENICKKFAEQNDQSFDTINDRYVNVYSAETLYRFLNGCWDESDIKVNDKCNLYVGKTQSYFTNEFDSYLSGWREDVGQYSFCDMVIHTTVTDKGYEEIKVNNDSKSIIERWKHFSEYYVIAKKEPRDPTNSNTDLVVYDFTLELNRINQKVLPDISTSYSIFNITEYGLIISV